MLSDVVETDLHFQLREAQQKITELEQALLEQRDRESLLQSVLDTIPVRVFWKERENLSYLGANRLFAEDGGVSNAADLIGKNDYDMVWAEQAELYRSDDRKVIDSETPKINYEEPQTSAHGETWLRTSKIPLRNSTGNVIGILGTYEDITPYKQAEQARDAALRRSELGLRLSQNIAKATTPRELLLTAMDSGLDYGNYTTSLSYIDLDQNGDPEYSTLVATSVPLDQNVVPLGTRFPIKDLPFSQIYFRDRDTPIIIEDVDTDPRLDEQTSYYYHLSRVSSTVNIPLYQNGRWVGILGIFWVEPHTFSEEERAHYAMLPRYITPVVDNLRLIEQLEANVEQLAMANALALENARLKSEFLATMSHELRTPLNAIEGFTSVILSNMGGVEYNHRTQHYVERVNTNSKRLLALINDFLDLSRIESGRLQLANSPFTPRQLVEKWQSQLGGLAQSKGLEFTVQVDERLPESLLGDEEQLSRVVVNLLSNAIKFTERGKVRLELHYGEDQWQLQVSDTGIGIPPHAREYIFEEFRQVDSSSKRKYGGTGLGLAIVQKLVRAMNGTITVESEVDEGSRFIVTLPLVG